MIMLFEMYHKGIKTTAEIRTVERDGEIFRKIMTDAGWVLTSVIAKGEMWTNEQMRMRCIHGGCCVGMTCIRCDDFEFQ